MEGAGGRNATLPAQPWAWAERTPAALPREPQRAAPGARPPPRALTSHLQQATGADQRSRATTDAAALPRGTGCSRHHPLPQCQPTPVKAYLVAGTPTSARTLRSPPVLPFHTFAPPLARVFTLRGARWPSLPLSHQESGFILLPLSSPHPPPTLGSSAPIGLAAPRAALT